MRFLTLNVERSTHLDRFIPFLQDYAADVACLQELVESDIATIQDATDLAHCHFVPMGRISGEPSPFGVGVLSRHTFSATDTLIYAGGGDGQTVVDPESADSRFNTMRFAAAQVRLPSDICQARVVCTHFPWTEEGRPTASQYAAADRMIGMLGADPLVLSGDFNAPRGGPVFDTLANQWIDCIPPEISTSIDPHLHRAGALQLMVDGLFASPELNVSDVRMHSGLSDHQAISATIDKP